MKTRLLASPWVKAQMTDETKEALEILSDNVWSEASILFAAERETKMKSGKSAPKGMQCYLNDVIVKRFTDSGWLGEAGKGTFGGVFLSSFGSGSCQDVGIRIKAAEY